MWSEVERFAQAARKCDIVGLFDEPNRAGGFSTRFDGMLLDYSKTALTAPARSALIGLAEASGVAARRAAMFQGAPINETEGRPVLHSALRNLSGGAVMVEGADIMPEITATRTRMAEFATHIRQGSVTDVVNIGIGGSHLGPEMAVRALRPYHDGPRCHFVSNVDGADIADTLTGLNPATTLVIVASKTFTTIETMTNATTARDWMAAAGVEPGPHFAAVSSATEKTADWGIDPARVFGFGDYVGGRYSVWGPIGLSLMIAIGPERFHEFLAGAEAMDHHFQDAAPLENMPMMLALIGLWHHQAMGYGTRAVLPYDQRLARLPAYLQQLEMESNGKRVSMSGALLERPSGPVVWGEPGTNGQHAFYQLIHQGTAVIPCEFLVAATGHEPELAHHHRLLVANCLAQSKALLRGRSLDEARALMRDAGYTGAELERQAAHRVFPGNRPSTTLIYDRLTPRRLGQIIALYEHRVFVEGVILGLNSFDQWGVELGKVLAVDVDAMLTGDTTLTRDGSTAALVAFARAAGV
ncbi:MAG: glucose-6-phosphate isomerase [Roseovarius sp. BRH_c41]|uniref:glucose-6-phosphate isomerase n=1 Tax=Roseovarius sp. BRH_c41 TaxID=1629709 RepID=UPI0005F2317E|nr:glucose-6-phosphate isomerase [Roseovarius sp. BRH_c41]KJS40451.1 MAG: glucose-6-phosphate isomerase [Roseovarius sp. BRH_c41]